jgi:3-oxoacyl-[acyl-carrier-protein] synthase-3
MGYGTQRIVDSKTTVSDLCVFGINYLFKNQLLDKETIGAVVLCTQSPDYFLPETSNVISGRLGLQK